MTPNQDAKGASSKEERPAPQATAKPGQSTGTEAPVRYTDWASI